jgi:hypothetical protein
MDYRKIAKELNMNTEAVRLIPLTSDLNMNIIFAKMALKKSQQHAKN